MSTVQSIAGLMTGVALIVLVYLYWRLVQAVEQIAFRFNLMEEHLDIVRSAAAPNPGKRPPLGPFDIERYHT